MENNNLIKSLSEAIDIEYDTSNEELVKLLELPLDELVEKGEAIADITASFYKDIETLNESRKKIRAGIPVSEVFLDLKKNKSQTDSAHKFSISLHDMYSFPKENQIFKYIRIVCKENNSKFRESSSVTLNGHGLSFNLVVFEDNDEEMILEINNLNGCDSIPPKLNNTEKWRLDNSKVDIRDTLKKACTLLLNNREKYNYVSGIFNGSILPEFSTQDLQKGELLAKKINFNPNQHKAFVAAYAVNNYFLIQGPPGTGKTFLLAQLALQFANEGKKVLITAFTHNAIDNALKNIAKISNYEYIVKVNKKTKRKNNAKGEVLIEEISDFRNSKYHKTENGVIVGSTCYSLFTKKLDFVNWDVIIVDEAGQLSTTLALPVMTKGEKLIFVGDHKQLSPIVSEKQVNKTFSISIFEHLFKFHSGVMLDITYRMNKEINCFPSEQFYNGELKPDKKNENWRLDIENRFNTNFKILDINKPDVLYCHNNNSILYTSIFEANLIADLVNEYLKNGVIAEEIAIITPFRAQVRQIKKSLSKIENYEEFKHKIIVDTVERIQGQEKDIIIISLVVSDVNILEKRCDFFYNPNRFNVALTRAKKKRIVIANEIVFNIYSENVMMNNLIDNFKCFYNNSSKVFDN